MKFWEAIKTGGRDLDLKVLTLIMMMTAASGVTAQTFDPAAEFSATNNPNGNWSYGYSTTLGGPLIRHTNHTQFNGIDAWNTDFLDGDPLVGHNPTAHSITYGSVTVGPGQLWLHPGPSNQRAVLRFAVTNGGHYLVQGNFFGEDFVGPTSTDVHVLVDSVSMFDGLVHGYGSSSVTSFTVRGTVVAGDFIDFAVGYGANNSFYFDSTGLSCTLTIIPPPIVGILTSANVASQWACTPFVVTATATSAGPVLTNLVVFLDGTKKLSEVIYSQNAPVSAATAQVTLKTDALGLHSLTAIATDVFGAVTVSSNLTVNVVAPPLHLLVADAFITNNQCLLCMSGQVGHAYSILASTNLQNWTNIGTMQNVNGLLEFPDPATTNFQYRFYRAQQQ
ncbi:MAG: hypothetical protein JWR26_4994 [Pedosphaera sp.]|nr:hypothetical protein [Pedosphaera sp.]